MRVAGAALVAVLLTAARALDGDPLLLDEFDPLALAALCFALVAGWPRGAAPKPVSALAALGIWTLVALAATAPAARLLLDGGRPPVELAAQVLALALVPACSEAIAVRASAGERGARIHALAWCALIALPLLVHHGLAFAASRASDAEVAGVRFGIAWLAHASPPGVALRAFEAPPSSRDLVSALGSFSVVSALLYALAALGRERAAEAQSA